MVERWNSVEWQIAVWIGDVRSGVCHISRSSGGGVVIISGGGTNVKKVEEGLKYEEKAAY